MRKQNFHFKLTFVVSILIGIILPIVLGVKEPMLIATTFSMVWIVYAIMLLVTVFLIRPGFKIKTTRKNGIKVVRYELLNRGKKR